MDPCGRESEILKFPTLFTPLFAMFLDYFNPFRIVIPRPFFSESLLQTVYFFLFKAGN